MNATIPKEFVIDLITNDLIHSKLLQVFYHNHVDASAYTLFLSSCIFKLMGFPEQCCIDFLYDRYTQLSLEAPCVDLSEGHCTHMRALATTIYHELYKMLPKSY